MSSDEQNEIIRAFRRAIEVTRSQLYDAEMDKQLPTSAVDHQRLPFLGYVGRSYNEKQIIIAAINPGGGRDNYSTTVADRKLIAAVETFRLSHELSEVRLFEEMCIEYQGQLQTWAIWRAVLPVLSAASARVDQICYLNIFPYRTRGDAMPYAQAMRNSWRLIVSPLVDTLHPRFIVGLGLKASRFMNSRVDPSKIFVIERSNGDTYIKPSAAQELDRLRAACEHP